MSIARLKRLWRSVEDLFPERHLYVRSGGEMRGYLLSTGKQLIGAGLVAFAALWMGISTASMLIGALSVSTEDKHIIKLRAYYERLGADRQARLNSAVAQLNDSDNNIDDLAASVEKRHAALSMLLTDFKGVPDAAMALTPAKPRLLATNSPVQRIQSTKLDQERLIDAAETFAKTRAERLRLAFRLAGLNAGTYELRGSSLGGPLIEAKDPRALAAVLDVDEDFASRIQRASSDMSAMKSLNNAAADLPFARPTSAPELSSSYGIRFDPFTHRPAFHSGLDFPASMFSPIYSTAPGVVSFTGVRAGYGNTVEVDHGDGFKTRYAHLSAFAVHVGQHVALGQRLASSGSTGRSTGPHLHYEVWSDGRVQNPNRFLRAGEYVQQAN